MAVQLIGRSQAFSRVLQAVAVAAPVDTSVLILGETGTGKEVVARAIHEAGPRCLQRFVPVNCAAIPAGLLESELFGHERGAFTGAVAQATGRFQAAHRGTLFLDEVGDLPLDLQPKLLRALQERHVERLGSGGRPVPVDVRVIAATNMDLWQMVQKRTFRADLYYRLNVFPIVLPPLRARPEDLPLLISYFVQHFAERHGRPITHLPDSVVHALSCRPWPGNIRELQNVIERAVIGSPGSVLQEPSADVTAYPPPASSRTLADVEREHIIRTLQETRGVVGGWDGAAARLGLSRTTLIGRMQRLGLARALEERDPDRLSAETDDRVRSRHHAADPRDTPRVESGSLTARQRVGSLPLDTRSVDLDAPAPHDGRPCTGHAARSLDQNVHPPE